MKQVWHLFTDYVARLYKQIEVIQSICFFYSQDQQINLQTKLVLKFVFANTRMLVEHLWKYSCYDGVNAHPIGFFMDSNQSKADTVIYPSCHFHCHLWTLIICSHTIPTMRLYNKVNISSNTKILATLGTAARYVSTILPSRNVKKY